jgi:hypothetical protein
VDGAFLLRVPDSFQDLLLEAHLFQHFLVLPLLFLACEEVIVTELCLGVAPERWGEDLCPRGRIELERVPGGVEASAIGGVEMADLPRAGGGQRDETSAEQCR